MKKTALAVLIAFVLLGLWGVGSYNGLARRSEGVSGAWAQVENQLQRRYDLIPNLVETVKGFAKHEKGLLEEVTRLRSQWGAAATPAEKVNAANALEGPLARLMVVMESYPQVKADQSFLKLQDELAGTENRIAVERMRYNETVRDFNTGLRTFPTSLVARLGGFTSKAYFEAAGEAKTGAPKVSF
jgi:LemA protein